MGYNKDIIIIGRHDSKDHTRKSSHRYIFSVLTFGT